MPDTNVATQLTLRPGMILGGRYRVVRMLGQGGMGSVFVAERIGLGGEVAVKVLLPQARGGEQAQRFRREASVLSRLHHPNVVEMHDFGEHEGLEYLVLEYVCGRNLRDELAAGALPWPRVIGILRQVAKALAAAHRLGLVHRDLKPANVMLIDHPGSPDHVKVLDFGIAKILVDSAELPGGSEQQTVQGTIIGTPQYMSPEQAVAGLLDGRSDLYSLGVVVFELLTGRTPFQGRTVGDLLRAHNTALVPPVEAPASCPAVPADLQALVLRLLAKEPDQRPASAEELLAELEALCQRHGLTTSGSLSGALAPATQQGAGRTFRGSLLAVVLGVALGAVLLGVLGLGFWWLVQTPPAGGAAPAPSPAALAVPAAAPPPPGVTPPPPPAPVAIPTESALPAVQPARPVAPVRSKPAAAKARPAATRLAPAEPGGLRVDPDL